MNYVHSVHNDVNSKRMFLVDKFFFNTNIVISNFKNVIDIRINTRTVWSFKKSSYLRKKTAVTRGCVLYAY